MRFTPHTDSDKEHLLEAIGLDAIEGLFDHIPQSLRDQASISLPLGLTEVEVRKTMAALAARNSTPTDWSFFLGGGIYHHAIPSTVDAVISRGEFATAYTPYQPEVSQGTLQATYEYQTMICQLTGMEVSNAGLYDGASGTAEAVLMARRNQKKRNRVFVSRALHPQYRLVIDTHLKNLENTEVVEIPFTETGETDMEFLSKELDHQAICVVVGYPNFFGAIEDLGSIREACTRHGVFLISVTTEALSMALLKPPGFWGADIAVGEGQSLGLPMALGGPGFGFFACQKKIRALHARKARGRNRGRRGDAWVCVDPGYQRTTYSSREGYIEHLYHPDSLYFGINRIYGDPRQGRNAAPGRV